MSAAHRIPPAPLDDELADLLDDITGIHPGLDLIADGIRLIALEPLPRDPEHALDRTQSVLAALAGAPGADIHAAIALLVKRFTDEDTNPALRHLPLDVRKDVQLAGEQHAYEVAEYDTRNAVGEAVAAISGI